MKGGKERATSENLLKERTQQRCSTGNAAVGHLFAKKKVEKVILLTPFWVLEDSDKSTDNFSFMNYYCIYYRFSCHPTMCSVIFNIDYS